MGRRRPVLAAHTCGFNVYHFACVTGKRSRFRRDDTTADERLEPKSGDRNDRRRDTDAGDASTSSCIPLCNIMRTLAPMSIRIGATFDMAPAAVTALPQPTADGSW